MVAIPLPKKPPKRYSTSRKNTLPLAQPTKTLLKCLPYEKLWYSGVLRLNKKISGIPENIVRSGQPGRIRDKKGRYADI